MVFNTFKSKIMMNCIILEDEVMALSIIEDYINKVPFLTLIESFRSPLKALNCVTTQKPDLLFLDINMPDLSGIEFLDNLNYQPYVIFTTAYSEYALKSYDYNTLDYLLKPIRFNRFLKAVNKANSYYNISQKRLSNSKEEGGKEVIFIKNSEGIHRIKLKEILFIESFKNYVSYNSNNGKIEVKKSLSEVEVTLPKHLFIRIHRSYIVNINFIKSLKYDGVTLTNEHKLPIGRSYREVLKNFMSPD